MVAVEKAQDRNGKVRPYSYPETATLDEAMELTGIGVYNIAHMLICGLILMGVIMQNLMLGYVMPAAQCDLQLSLHQRGWLAAIPFISIILTSHMWGYLADTRGRRPVMVYSMLLCVLLSIIASFAPNLLFFAVFEFLSAIFMSGTSAVVYTYLGEFNNLRHRDKMVAFGASFVGIGTVVLPAVAWLIFPLDFSYPLPMGIIYRPWRLLVVLCAVPYAISTVLMFFAPESPKFLHATGQSKACLEVVKKIYSTNKRMNADSFPVQQLVSEQQSGGEVEVEGDREEEKRRQRGTMWASIRDQTLPLFKFPLLPWICLTCFVQFGILAATNGFYVWFPSILNAIASHDGGSASICSILDAPKHNLGNDTAQCDDTMQTDTFQRSIYMGLVFCSAYLIVGFLVDILGKKLILIALLGVSGVCGIGAHLAPDQQVGVVLFAVFQMSGACIGLMNAAAVDLFPTKYRAMAVCLSLMMGRLGSVVGSNLIGVFLTIYCGASFYLFGGLLLVCSLLCLTLPGKKQATKQSPSENNKTRESTLNETHEPV